MSAASSIASSSLRLSPCESEPGGRRARARRARPARAPRCARSTASRTRGRPPPDPHRAAAAPPPRRGARSRAPSSSGKTFETWNVRPSPACARRYGGCVRDVDAVELDASRSSAGSRPESRLKSVVLPAPFGPMTARNSPSRTSSPTSATIVAPPMSSPRSRREDRGAHAQATLRDPASARPAARVAGGERFTGTARRLAVPFTSLTRNIGCSIA